MPLEKFLRANNWSLAALDSAVKHGFAEILFPNGQTCARLI